MTAKASANQDLQLLGRNLRPVQQIDFGVKPTVVLELFQAQQKISKECGKKYLYCQGNKSSLMCTDDSVIITEKVILFTLKILY